MEAGLIWMLYLLVATMIISVLSDISERRASKRKARREMLSNHKPLEFLDEANEAEFNDWLTNGKTFSYVAQEIELAKVIAERDTYKQLCERAIERSKEQWI